MISRRDFVRNSVLTGGSLVLADSVRAGEGGALPALGPLPQAARPRLPSLEPARWIWYPSERTLQNTFVLFRREVAVGAGLTRATGWIVADSRYRLHANGERVQWGPAPSDPRWPEADPVDLTGALKPGKNVLAATVLFYGQGDGTWPIGKPGFLFWTELEYADGRKDLVVSDPTWQCLLCRAWQAGHYKRWYLRALQEEFDARDYPHGWDKADFAPSGGWVAAMALTGSPNRPSLSTNYQEYMSDLGQGPADTELFPRSVPMMAESLVTGERLAESLWLEWSRPPREYFEMKPPDAFRVVREPCAAAGPDGGWSVELDGKRGAVLTFELKEQVVGWPYFTIEAPEGAVVELLVHEAHVVGGPALINSHFNSWTRFTCAQGTNRFETFDFESLRWLQLHIHGVRGRVAVRDIGVRRRAFPWPNPLGLRSDEPALQRLFDATANTLMNCAQDTIVDGMARERQQYSGDGAHQLHAIQLAFGETRLPARFVRTFSQGMTKDGFFMDSWPAYDRLSRLAQRQLDLTRWGPILDHSIEFNFDCWYHYNYTGDLAPVAEALPRLVRFFEYLRVRVGGDGLLPVEDLGVPSVWMDEDAYLKQRHKQCAYNLYAAAMLQNALAPLCQAFGKRDHADSAKRLGASILAAAVRAFWSAERGTFINNLPWLGEEGAPRQCDRSLATAVLFDQFPGGNAAASLKALADCPPEMGFSYPCNAGWRLWALAKGGRADVIVRDLRLRWATLPSVRLNDTLQEGWTCPPDSNSQWSHSAVVPLYIVFMGLFGLRPKAPGFAGAEIRPQLADLGSLDATAHTVRGPIAFAARGTLGARELTIQMPEGCDAEILLKATEACELQKIEGPAPEGMVRYHLPAGAKAILRLQST